MKRQKKKKESQEGDCTPYIWVGLGGITPPIRSASLGPTNGDVHETVSSPWEVEWELEARRVSNNRIMLHNAVKGI